MKKITLFAATALASFAFATAPILTTTVHADNFIHETTPSRPVQETLHFFGTDGDNFVRLSGNQVDTVYPGYYTLEVYYLLTDDGVYRAIVNYMPDGTGTPPATEVPKTDAPTTEMPTTEAPMTSAPTTEMPTTEAPTTSTPTTEMPTTKAKDKVDTKTTEPKADTPKSDMPKAETKQVEKPKAETKQVEKPKAETKAPEKKAEVKKELPKTGDSSSIISLLTGSISFLGAYFLKRKNN